MSEPRSITCALCQRVFQSEWSDEEADAEAREIWRAAQASTNPDFVNVCDDCWQRIAPRPFVRSDLLR